MEFIAGEIERAVEKNSAQSQLIVRRSPSPQPVRAHGRITQIQHGENRRVMIRLDGVGRIAHKARVSIERFHDGAFSGQETNPVAVSVAVVKHQGQGGNRRIPPHLHRGAAGVCIAAEGAELALADRLRNLVIHRDAKIAHSPCVHVVLEMVGQIDRLRPGFQQLGQPHAAVAFEVGGRPLFDLAIRRHALAAHSNLEVQRFVNEFAHSLVIVGEFNPAALARRPKHFDRGGGEPAPEIPAVFVKMRDHRFRREASQTTSAHAPLQRPTSRAPPRSTR